MKWGDVILNLFHVLDAHELISLVDNMPRIGVVSFVVFEWHGFISVLFLDSMQELRNFHGKHAREIREIDQITDQLYNQLLNLTDW